MEDNINPEEIISGKSLSFDTGIAQQCGVNAAIVFNHICYWLNLNEDNPECQFDGKIWMYESQRKMSGFFKFFSEKEVRDYIKILLDHGLLVKKKMCDNPFDQTNWYSLSDVCFQKVFSKRRIRRIDTDLAVPSEQTNSSHVYNEEDIKKDLNINNIIYTPEKCEKPKTKKAADDAENKIFFKNKHDKRDFVFKKDAYLWAINYPTDLIQEALNRISQQDVLINDFRSYFLTICDRLVRERQKKSNEFVDADAARRKKERDDEEIEYKRKLEEHRKKPKVNLGELYEKSKNKNA